MKWEIERTRKQCSRKGNKEEGRERERERDRERRREREIEKEEGRERKEKGKERMGKIATSKNRECQKNKTKSQKGEQNQKNTFYLSFAF